MGGGGPLLFRGQDCDRLILQQRQYSGLLLDDGSSTNSSDQFCTGIIVSDLYINPGTFPGADAQIIIRSNGQQGANQRSLGIIASIDNFPAPGYFFLQQCGGATAWCGNGGGPAGTGGMPAVGEYRRTNGTG